MDFGRVITAMVTPFDSKLQIDWEEVGKLIDFLVEEQKTDSLVVCGTTGESPTLSDEEKIKLFQAAVKHANGRCKIIAGTGSYDTSHSVHLTKLAEQTGVDGILLVAPYYNRPSQDGLYSHFETIANATSLPVMLYNIPSRTNINVDAKTTLRLAHLSNVVATKEAHNDLELITELVANAPEGFRVYSGDDANTLPFLAIGAYGVVSVASHVVGKEIRAILDAYLNGEVQQAAKLHGKLLPVFKGMFNCPHRVPNPAAVKYALELRGIRAGGLRLPLVPVTEAEGRFIQALFE